MAAMRNHAHQLDDMLRQHADRAAELEAAATQVHNDVDAGGRRPLTRQGDTLVDAVATTLRDLGFGVQIVDDELAANTAKREDLRVYQAGDGWEALAAVRGYKGGASLNDLLRIERFVGLFLADEHRRPAAVWYVVNQFLTTDPDTRPKPLAGIHKR